MHTGQSVASSSSEFPKISIRNLWKVFDPKIDGRSFQSANELADAIRSNGGRAAVQDVNFDIVAGEIFVIMGLSGSGKSTVLRMLSRLIEPTYGEVLIDGEDVTAFDASALRTFRRNKIGMVFQNFGLVPHFTVLENVAYPMRVQGVRRAARERRAREVIELVGLGGREDSLPRQLSGGQQQRVGIARSLATEPDIWLLDEPFSALDPLIRRQMQDEFIRLQAALKKTIVFITHDFAEAVRVSDRIAIMRDGVTTQIGTAAELLLTPADAFVAEFTRDAPRDKVLKARDIAVLTQGESPTQTAVEATATVAQVATVLKNAGDVVAVRAADGTHIGDITFPILVKAMVLDK